MTDTDGVSTDTDGASAPASVASVASVASAAPAAPATPAAPAAPAKNRRGRETATDMVRSLGVVMLLVVALWYFGQASPGDEQRIRPVDPASELAAFTQDTPGVPVPGAAPAGWTINVAAYEQERLRIGYVIDDQQFAEFAAGTGEQWVAEQTARGKPVSTVDVAGVAWQLLRSATDQESLVRVVGSTTLIVGGVRESATLDSLKTLAATVR